MTSKPRDRRMLIEEAAGLGKHRKRRRRAQLKLARTQDNLDRALDVEREARTRLRPLKRQAEAAELHERLERQTDEALWALAREDVRAAGAGAGARPRRPPPRRGRRRRRPSRSCARSPSGASRPSRRWPRAAASARGCRTGSTPRARRASGSALREEAARQAAATLLDRAGRRRALLTALEAEAAADTGDDGAGERIAALEAELAQLADDRRERLDRELAELQARRREGRGGARGPGRGGRGRRRGAARGRRRRRGGPRAPAARPRRRPSAPAARPPAPAPSSRSSTSSCAPTPARRAAPRRWPTS